MNTIRIIYPKFWVQPKVKHIFSAQLDILKTHYCHGKNIGANQIYIPPLFNELKLESPSLFLQSDDDGQLCNKKETSLRLQFMFQDVGIANY
jgi:hypothetical protein